MQFKISKQTSLVLSELCDQLQMPEEKVVSFLAHLGLEAYCKGNPLNIDKLSEPARNTVIAMREERQKTVGEIDKLSKSLKLQKKIQKV